MIETLKIETKTNKELAREKILLINNILDSGNKFHHGFLGGSLGLLYYYYNSNRVLEDNKILKNAENLLAIVFDDLNESGNGINGPLFSNGAAGFAYTINYLQKNGFIDFDIEVEFAEIENYLFNEAKKLVAIENIDYLHGALGIVHYFTTRAESSPKANEYLEILVKEICTKVVLNKDGVWFKNYGLERLKENDLADLGLAHGLSGILLILMNAWHFLQDKSDVELIIKSGIKYMLSNQMPIEPEGDEYSCFPVSVDNKNNILSRINRLAWCYGDLNEVLLLYRAGKLFGDSFYTEKADEIGFGSIERKSEATTMCDDAHFCHGTAGLAQFYKCLYYESGQHTYFKAYEYWIDITITKIDKEIISNAYSKNPIGLLEGWAGIAMVLAEYISNERGSWSKAFLL